MASVTPVKRASGYAWRVQARDESRKMRQETFYGEDARAVEAAARRFAKLVDRVGITEASRIRDARDRQSGSATPTLAEFIATYLDKGSGMLTGVTDGTRHAYRRMADATILPRLGDLPVNEIGEDDVSAWITWLESQPSPRDPSRTYADKTIRNHHGFLSQVLTAAAARGKRAGNPARGVKITRRRRTGMVILTQSEFLTLLHFIPQEHRPLITWLAGTGMRWGEATALTWGDLDTDARPALVHITKAWKKPASGRGRELGPPKSEAGTRTISVPDRLVSALGTPGRGDALVFATSKGTPLWSGSFYPRVWTPAVDAANDADRCAAAGLTAIGKRPRVHDLRHAHASWLIAAGRPLYYIQRRLGHEDITTTTKTYSHLMPDTQQGDADAVDLMLAGALPEIEDALPLIEG